MIILFFFIKFRIKVAIIILFEGMFKLDRR